VSRAGFEPATRWLRVMSGILPYFSISW